MIEFLTKNPESRYEDLLNKIQVGFSINRVANSCATIRDTVAIRYGSWHSTIAQNNELTAQLVLCFVQ